jgi:hypothetical protein
MLRHTLLIPASAKASRHLRLGLSFVNSSSFIHTSANVPLIMASSPHLSSSTARKTTRHMENGHEAPRRGCWWCTDLSSVYMILYFFAQICRSVVPSLEKNIPTHSPGEDYRSFQPLVPMLIRLLQIELPDTVLEHQTFISTAPCRRVLGTETLYHNLDRALYMATAL